MNPALTLLYKDIWNEFDYTSASAILKRSKCELQALHIETTKEMILFKLHPQTTVTLTMRHIESLKEQDCMEYNIMYNKNFNVPSYIALQNTAKSKLVLSILNEGQRNVLYEVIQAISCNTQDHVLCVLDAPSGTGKSFLIDCLHLCLRNIPMTIVARNKTLLHDISNLEHVEMFTTCKFIMDTFLLEYKDAVMKFDDVKTKAALETLFKDLMKQRRPLGMKLLILDEYSMEPSVFLCILILIAKMDKTHLLFIGDSMQQNTLTSCLLHNASNFELLSVVPQVKILQLQEQMRIKDDKLLDAINLLKLWIEHGIAEVNGNIKMTFQCKYEIYEKMQPLFRAYQSPLDVVFLTDTHRVIKKRMEQLLQYAKEFNIKHRVEPYEMIEQGVRTNVNLPSNEKFLHGLCLIEGGQYLYKKKEFVTLVTINADHLVVIGNKTQQTTKLRKVLWTRQQHDCVDRNFTWIMEHCPGVNKILQYPLRMAVFTHYFVQGLTFDMQKVIIDIDAKYVNSLYVSFSRITKIGQLVQLSSVDLPSLLYTEYKNDNFLYVVNSRSARFMKEIKSFHENKDHRITETSIPAKIERRKVVTLNNNINNLDASPSLEQIKKSKTTVLEEALCHWYQSQTFETV